MKMLWGGRAVKEAVGTGQKESETDPEKKDDLLLRHMFRPQSMGCGDPGHISKLQLPAAPAS
jgi:hypothetical protein